MNPIERAALAMVTLLVIAPGCGSDDSNDTTAASDTGSTSDATTTTGAATSNGGSSEGESTTSVADTSGDAGNDSGSDDAASSSEASTGGGASMYMIDASRTPCFSLATGTANADNPCTSGDLYFLIGFNVDLGDAGQMAWCSTGAASSLDDVPTDYAACAWQSYVEGGDGLANTGYIVRDATAMHHYRFQIDDNTAPVLQFDYDAID